MTEQNNNKMYKCNICDTKPDQLSHHKSHLKSSKHKDKKLIKKLELEKIKEDDLTLKYKTNNVDTIIKQLETVKIKPKRDIDRNKKKKN